MGATLNHPWTHTLLKILMSKIKLAIFDMIKSWERNIRTLARYFLLKFLKRQTLFSVRVSQQGRRQGEAGSGGASAPQCSTDQVTLSQPGGRLCPPQYYQPPGFSDLATGLFNIWFFWNISVKNPCPNKKFWVNFSLKVRLLLLVLFIQVMYKKVYFVKLCPNFVDSPSFHFKIYQKNPLEHFTFRQKSVYLILYHWTWNSTTGIAILHNVSKVPLHVSWLTTFKNSFTCHYFLFSFFLKTIKLSKKHRLLFFPSNCTTNF